MAAPMAEFGQRSGDHLRRVPDGARCFGRLEPPTPFCDGVDPDCRIWHPHTLTTANDHLASSTGALDRGATLGHVDRAFVMVLGAPAERVQFSQDHRGRNS